MVRVVVDAPVAAIDSKELLRISLFRSLATGAVGDVMGGFPAFFRASQFRMGDPHIVVMNL